MSVVVDVRFTQMLCGSVLMRFVVMIHHRVVVLVVVGHFHVLPLGAMALVVNDVGMVMSV